jgi:uncharacterized protein
MASQTRARLAYRPHASRNGFALWLGLWLLVTGLLWAPFASALEVPALKGRVNDYAGLLSSEAAQRIEARLEAYEKKTGHQIALLTVPSLEGDPIEDFGIRVAGAWKLGRSGQDDGAILIISKGDRAYRIETGYGLEGDLPDALVGRIGRERLIPAFRRGDYEGGIDGALGGMIAATGGDGDPLGEPPRQAARGRRGPSLGSWLPLLLFLVFFVFPWFGGGRRGRGRRGSMFFLPGGFGGGRGGFGGGGFGGGGGFSGGGGGFGGGGASGRW